MTYRIRFTKQARKDVQKLTPKLRDKLKIILRQQIVVNPRAVGEPLVGDLAGYYSVRLSYKDRIVYSIHDDELLVLVIRARTMATNGMRMTSYCSRSQCSSSIISPVR